MASDQPDLAAQPYLAAFVAQVAHPYDPAADAYSRAPFAQPVRAGKNSPIYNAHPYHTKVPPDGIVPYIVHYTDPGDLVLDPFCGSGMTGVAARMAGRNAILSDLSPAAVHIARNYNTPVDVQALRRELERIRAAVRDEFNWLYGTACDRCGGPATIRQTIWSDLFACARCSGEILLWDVAVDRETGKVAAHFPCPTCRAQWKKTDLRWLRSEPVVTRYECPRCKPRRAGHPTTPAEKRRIAEIDAAGIPYWYPTTPFDASWEMWRGVHRHQGITGIDRFFTRRNLRAYARLWHEAGRAPEPRLADVVRFALTGIANYVNKRQSYGGGGGGVSGTLYVASLTMEKNVGQVWERKVLKLIGAFSVARYDDHARVHVRVGSATDLAAIPDQSIDYVFADPPFGSSIFYADCNLMWEAWLNEGFTDQAQEAVLHVKHRDRNTLPDYARLMADSFREMHRVLKPGRWASVVFHNSDNRVWQAILDAAEAAGLALVDFSTLDKEQLSFKGIRGDKGLERVANKDIVLNLQKPRLGHTLPQVSLERESLSVERACHSSALEPRDPAGGSHNQTEQRVVATVADLLATDPPPGQRTLQHLWNHVLYDMLRDGSVQVSMADVESILARSPVIRRVDGRYYLRDQEV